MLLLKEDASVVCCSNMQTGKYLLTLRRQNIALSSLLFDCLALNMKIKTTHAFKMSTDIFSQHAVRPQKNWIYRCCGKTSVIKCGTYGEKRRGRGSFLVGMPEGNIRVYVGVYI